MSNPGLSDGQLLEALRAYEEFNGNKTKAAEALNVNRSTFIHRLAVAKQKFDATIDTSSGFDIDQDAEGIDNQLLKDRIRKLEAQLSTIQRDNLDAEFVKKKILKLAEQPVKPPDWMIKPKSSSESTGVPTLLASDWHWGEVVDPRQVNGVNEYNIGIAQDRAKVMVETTVELLKQHIKHKQYPGIVFALGGDMVSGDLHEELTATNEREIMPCVLDLWATLVWCIETLANEFGHVFVPCVSGNHGRNTHKTRNKGRNYTSFDWLVYQFLAKRFENDKRVQFHIPDGPDANWSIYGHRYCMTHGDAFRGGDGVIGALGPIIRGDHKKRTRNSQIDMGYDTLLMGHFHQLIQLQRLIVNGSLKGYCEYAFSNNFSFEPPRQALWITHPKHGITFSAPVMVDKNTQVKSRDWISWTK